MQLGSGLAVAVASSWELPYATSAALKNKQTKKNPKSKKKERNTYTQMAKNLKEKWAKDMNRQFIHKSSNTQKGSKLIHHGERQFKAALIYTFPH